jgi:hypothetical protein
MKRGLYRKMRGNNEVSEGNPKRIHLLTKMVESMISWFSIQKAENPMH